MFYHLAMLAPPAQRQAFREGTELRDRLRREERRARAKANRQVGRGLLAAIGGFLRQQRALAARRRAEAATIRELQSLSDRALEDIGLHRADIRRIARQLVENRARILKPEAQTDARLAVAPLTPHLTPRWDGPAKVVRPVLRRSRRGLSRAKVASGRAAAVTDLRPSA